MYQIRQPPQQLSVANVMINSEKQKQYDKKLIPTVRHLKCLSGDESLKAYLCSTAYSPQHYRYGSGLQGMVRS